MSRSDDRDVRPTSRPSRRGQPTSRRGRRGQPPTSGPSDDDAGEELCADDELALPELLGPLVAAERARPAVDATAIARVRAGASARWIDGRFFAWSWRARGVWLGIGGALGLAAGLGIGVALGTSEPRRADGPADEAMRSGSELDERAATNEPMGAPSVEGIDDRASPDRGGPLPALHADRDVDAPTDLGGSRDVERGPGRDVREGRESSDAPSALVDERVLLDRARALVRERRAEEALAVLASYAARHRDGALREEAAALEVRARLASGAIELAERAFERLVADYPTSLHRDALRRAIDGVSLSAGSAADGTSESAGSAADGTHESAGSAADGTHESAGSAADGTHESAGSAADGTHESGSAADGTSQSNTEPVRPERAR